MRRAKAQDLGGILVAVVALIIHSLGGVSGSEFGTDASQHSPIYIVGDDGFTAANGVTGGSGTPGDPYVIEGWEIDASTGHGVYVQGTTASFVIRNVSVHSGGDGSVFYRGIFLSDVSNGRVEDVRLEGNYIGAQLAGSNITVKRSTIVHNALGIVLVAVNRVTISDSNISQNSGDGIDQGYPWSGHSSSITIERNTISENRGEGVFSIDCSSVTISNNTIGKNGLDGLVLSGCTTASVTGNEFNSDGVSLQGTEDIALSDNNFWSGTVSMLWSVRSALTRNRFVAGGLTLASPLRIGGDLQLEYASHEITPDNLVNGRPLRFYKNCDGLTVDGVSAGQLIVVNCTHVRLAHLEITGAPQAIMLALVDSARVEENNLTGNGRGVLVSYGSNVTLAENRAAWNSQEGIVLAGGTEDATIAHNILLNNSYGIGFGGSHAIIRENEVAGNIQEGIYLGWTASATIANNTITRNGIGVHLYAPNATTVVDNTISENGVGLEVTAPSLPPQGFDPMSDDPALLAYHNNFIDDRAHVGLRGLSWDNGYPSGGNYWWDYAGQDNCSGTNQDICPDSDGIGDTPYVINAYNLDRYPLMHPIAPRDAPPTVSIGSDVASGVAPLEVSFTSSISGGLPRFTYNWSFGDGTTSSVADPTHAYAAPGQYHVMLVVTDYAGTEAGAATTLVVYSRLSVSAEGDRTEGASPLEVAFDAVPFGGVAPYSFQWSFGDGGMSSDQKPSHVYSQAGTYDAAVIVADSSGQTATASILIVADVPAGGGSLPLSGDEVAILAGVVPVTAAAVGTAVFLLRRRRGPN